MSDRTRYGMDRSVINPNAIKLKPIGSPDLTVAQEQAQPKAGNEKGTSRQIENPAVAV